MTSVLAALDLYFAFCASCSSAVKPDAAKASVLATATSASSFCNFLMSSSFSALSLAIRSSSAPPGLEDVDDIKRMLRPCTLPGVGSSWCLLRIDTLGTWQNPLAAVRTRVDGWASGKFKCLGMCASPRSRQGGSHHAKCGNQATASLFCPSPDMLPAQHWELHTRQFAARLGAAFLTKGMGSKKKGEEDPGAWDDNLAEGPSIGP